MKILVIGGTRFFGIHMVHELLSNGHDVTIATRGNAKDEFSDKVTRIIIERTDEDSIKRMLAGKHYDVVIDKIGYCSNDIKILLDTIQCDKYIYMSTTAVYEPKHLDTKEEEYDGLHHELLWCARGDYSYSKIKQQAENALCQAYDHVQWVAVRYPFVIGKDDYTKRLLFYVEHAMKGIPMYIDNIDQQMAFIDSHEAGRFIAYLVDKDYAGTINGSSYGTISIREILDYVQKKTEKTAMLNKDGDVAPYNTEVEYSINTDRAKSLGFEFSKLSDWIYELIDYYIEQVRKDDENGK